MQPAIHIRPGKGWSKVLAFLVSAKRFNLVNRGVINDFAFDVYNEYAREIDRTMTVRMGLHNLKRAFMAVRKARSVATVTMATVGSVRRDRFTGWTEQEYGDKRRGTRVPTLHARGLLFRKKWIGRYRAKPMHKWPDETQGPTRYAGSLNANFFASPKIRTMVYLRQMKKKPVGTPFKLSGQSGSGFSYGIYRFRDASKTKLALIQSLKARPRQPKRHKPLEDAARRKINYPYLRKHLRKNIRRYMGGNGKYIY
jgi:hypothetical protein